MGTLRAAYAYTPAVYLKEHPPRRAKAQLPIPEKKKVSVRVHVHEARYEGK